ncbi:MAG: cob(I)yrinic acid a,c-diamide adenosyltransferase [bacterium]
MTEPRRSASAPKHGTAPRIYSRSGDRGDTGLIGGRRVRKDHARVEAYGAVDEVNSQLGLVRTLLSDPTVAALLDDIQHRLFDLGAELATPSGARSRTTTSITAANVQALEDAIDRYQAMLPALREFILPGGTPLAAALHVARTVSRRAERRTVTLSRRERLNGEIVKYLNRLSDLLFVLARWANHLAGQRDVTWQPSNRNA